MRQDDVFERAIYWLVRDRIPVTKALVLTNVVTYLALALFNAGAIVHYLGFSTLKALAMPWAFLTYPLVGAY